VSADERRELLDLIVAHSFERRRVVLSSGRESDFYLDLRRTLMRPRGVVLAGRLVLEKLRGGPPVDAVGGMAVGAVPLVAAVLAAADADPDTDDLLGFFVRKQAKQHGLGRRIEGELHSGARVALVEDTCTTGGSLIEALDAVEEAGAEAVRALCVVDRGEGSRERFAERGLALEAVFSRDDLPV